MHHDLRPLHTLVFETLDRHDLIYHPHLLSFLSGILTAEKPNLTRLLLADDTGEIRRAETGIKTSHLRPRLSKDGILTGNRQVADKVQHMTTTNGIAIHHGNNGFGQTTDLHLYVEYGETGHALLIDIAATAFHVHIATTAKSMLHFGQRLSLWNLRHGTSQ